MLQALDTAHGRIELPAFLPDATRGVVRSLDSGDLDACGIQGVCVNAFHLSSNPGAGAIASVGDIHTFMGFGGAVLCDSGGFQVYSLLRENPRAGSISRHGLTYRGGAGEKTRRLTPARCMQQQLRMRVDLAVCLDHCTHPDDPAEVQRQSVENTIAWARDCRREFDRRTEPAETKPLLLAVVQGGVCPDLRRRCAESLAEIGFDGYGFGGWPVDNAGRLVDAVGITAELLPPNRPTWALGIGKPEHVVAAAAMGYDLFDCVIPTRDARHGRLYAFLPGANDRLVAPFYEPLYIADDRHIRDGRPIEEGCDCLTCTRYSRAYLHHLFHVKEASGMRLATVHNLRFYARLMEHLRRQRREHG